MDCADACAKSTQDDWEMESGARASVDMVTVGEAYGGGYNVD